MRLDHYGTLSAMLLLGWGIATAQQPAPDVKSASTMAIHFHSGTVIRNVTVLADIEIVTKYGKFVVPAADIRKLEFGFRIPDEDGKTLEAALKSLTTGSVQQRENAANQLILLGRVAYPSLDKILKSKADADTTQRVTKIIEAIQRKTPLDQKLSAISHEDVITTAQGVVLRGTITTNILKARERVLGEIQLPFAHMHSVKITESGPVVDRNFAKAVINLTEEGTGNQAGSIAQSGASDVYGIVAPRAGRMTIRQNQALGSGIDSHLYVYDANKNQLAEDDDGGDGNNSLIRINVNAGQIYYIRAAGHSGSTGDYELFITMSE